MDKLERFMADKQAELKNVVKQIDELAKRHEHLLIEMSVLKQAAALIPSGPPKSVGAALAGQGAGTRGGRQKGDISRKWQEVLRKLWHMHRRVSFGEIQMLAQDTGMTVKLPSVRERVRNMVQTKLMTGNAKSGFMVTKHAAERFSFAEKDETPDAGTSGASKTDGASTPSNEGQEISDLLGRTAGVPPSSPGGA